MAEEMSVHQYQNENSITLEFRSPLNCNVWQPYRSTEYCASPTHIMRARDHWCPILLNYITSSHTGINPIFQGFFLIYNASPTYGQYFNVFFKRVRHTILIHYNYWFVRIFSTLSFIFAGCFILFTYLVVRYRDLELKDKGLWKETNRHFDLFSPIGNLEREMIFIENNLLKCRNIIFSR